MNIKLRVKNLIERWGTRDPFRLCEYLKIVVSYKELENIRGYYTKCLKKKNIVLNENLDELSMKVVLAHELGHAILHKKEINLMKESFMFPKNLVVEKEANKFAAELLIDDESNIDDYTLHSDLEIEVFGELRELKKLC
ncbi:MAG: ImmA/IrrE family metallo-endopeptidase [Fusobacteriaceae bacterium]